MQAEETVANEAVKADPAVVALDPNGTATPKEPRVQLGMYTVPVSFLVGCAKAGCSRCSGRAVIHVLTPKPHDEFCFCAVRRAQIRIEEHLRNLEAEEAAAVPAVPSLVNSERSERKVTNLRAEVERLEREYRDRKARLDQYVADERQRASEAVKQADAATKTLDERKALAKVLKRIEKVRRRLALAEARVGLDTEAA